MAAAAELLGCGQAEPLSQRRIAVAGHQVGRNRQRRRGDGDGATAGPASQVVGSLTPRADLFPQISQGGAGSGVNLDLLLLQLALNGAAVGAAARACGIFVVGRRLVSPAP